MKIKLFIFANIFLLLIGCAATGPAFKPYSDLKSDESLIYIFRPKTNSFSVITAIFKINGQQIASLENNAYAAITVKPGDYTITQYWKAGTFGDKRVEGKPTSITIHADLNKTTYIKLYANTEIGGGAYVMTIHSKWGLREVPETDAQDELSHCVLANTESKK